MIYLKVLEVPLNSSWFFAENLVDCPSRFVYIQMCYEARSTIFTTCRSITRKRFRFSSLSTSENDFPVEASALSLCRGVNNSLIQSRFFTSNAKKTSSNTAKTIRIL